MLRIALPNKGSLSEAASRLFAEAGYRQRRDSKELRILDADNHVEFFYLRPRDIAVYVGAGTVDAGVTGRDLLVDSGASAMEYRALGFGRSTFRFAAPEPVPAGLEDIGGRRVATSYDVLVGKYLDERGVDAEVVHLDGAVETSVDLGVADLVADVVETGTTLRAAGLHVFGEPILESEALVITAASRPTPPGFDVVDRRLHGVLVAREYVLLDYDIPLADVDAAVAVTPGLESPTISPLHDGTWVAVRAMVPRSQTNRVMDALYAVGARAILVTSIEACRL
ncbi:MAG: ATP phosphoribosyltransferase [Bowdeniella nasicola]|nr:ATP phosphoribosyltransferase [Bowdeniella nasicola]